MSAPEPGPFAVVKPVTYRVYDVPTGFLHDLIVGGDRIVSSSRGSCEKRAAAINAAVQRERQAAKAEALRDFAAWCATVSAAPNAIGPLFGAGVLSAAKMIGAEATSRSERAWRENQ